MLPPIASTRLTPVLLVGLLLTACNKGTPRSDSTPSVVRLPILSATALHTLDPIQSVEPTQYNLDNQIFEGLVDVGVDGAFVPELAASWTHSDDYRIWRFELRDARFANDRCFPDGQGRKVVASDVVYSLRRGLAPRSGSKNSWALSTRVKGAAAFAAGKSSEVSGLRRIDSDTIEIELAEGDRFFLAALTVPSTYVVAREAVEHYGEQFGRHPVGSGPFRLVGWPPGQHITLEKNSNYGQGSGWQPRAPSVDTVRFVFYRSEAQIASAFDRGELDAREIVGADHAAISGDDPISELSAIAPHAIAVRPGWICKVHLLAPMMGDGFAFGGSPSARRALSQLLQRDRLARTTLRGSGKPQASVLPDVLFPEVTAVPALADPEAKLRQAVAGRQVRLAYVSSRINDAIVRMTKEILENAGASAVLFPNTSINALFTSLSSTKPDLTLIYWYPYYPSVPDYLTALLSSSRPVPNFTGFTNEDLDKLAAELRSPSGRPPVEIAGDIDKLLSETMPWIPIYAETPILIISKRLRGFALSPVSTMRLVDVTVHSGP